MKYWYIPTALTILIIILMLVLLNDSYGLTRTYYGLTCLIGIVATWFIYGVCHGIAWIARKVKQ